MNIKSTILLVLFSNIIVIGTQHSLYKWQSPGVNPNPKVTLYDYLFSNPHKTDTIESMGASLTAKYIENVSADCTNPYFPIIQIKTESPHNAWLQIVHTDSKSPDLQHFIDTVDPKTNPYDIYPFYTLDQDFYDGPIWQYDLFSKPVSYWKAHAYAIQVDRNKKAISVIGGVSWGFTLSNFRLRPKMILPQSLTENDWQNDWQFFKKEFPGYTIH